MKFRLQEVAANCHEFADYANLIGINSSCKMRWSGQWPGTQQSQLTPDMTQQSISSGMCSSGDDPATLAQQRQQQPQQPQQQQQQSQQGPVLSVDQHLHQQLCVEQFKILSQYQVNVLTFYYFEVFFNLFFSLLISTL